MWYGYFGDGGGDKLATSVQKHAPMLAADSLRMRLPDMMRPALTASSVSRMTEPDIWL